MATTRLSASVSGLRHAQYAFTAEALAAELADEGINVNAVLPSIIDTPQNRRDMPDADTRNWVRPQDLARVVLFFLGPDSAAVTGAALPVTLGPRAEKFSG